MESQINLDKEAISQSQKNWDNMSEWYANRAEWSTSQGLVTCATMAKVQEAKRVLEVACGSGRHSNLLASQFLQTGGVLVSCDFSNEMVKMLKDKYDGGQFEYSLVKGNKYLMDTDTDYLETEGSQLKNKCDINQIIADQGEFRKFVYGCQANNELLPFSDGVFDAYVANLSLQLVNNPQNMIREAYRVLQPKSAACFTIWGDRSRSLQFTFVEDFLKKYKPGAERSNFDLWADEGVKLKSYLDEAGFTEVKMWRQPTNFLIKNGEEHFSKGGMGSMQLSRMLADKSEEERAQIRLEAIAEWNKLCENDLKTMECVVVYAWKE